jgi:hypothetical protein
MKGPARALNRSPAVADRSCSSSRCYAAIVESVGYGIGGDPLVNLGRVVLDDLQVAQLRKAGWRGVAVPGGPTR